jgi:8-oxo-dGTP pyrophosphatase MutT (NUDIX family)
MTKISHDSETPAHGQQVIIAGAFIHHDFSGVTKLFLAKRADTKKFQPGVYEIPGGHVDFGEDIVAGLKREIMEEFGITISVGDPFAAFTYANHVKGSHTVEVLHFALFTDPLSNITIHPQDHAAYIWLAEHELSRAYTSGKGADDSEFQAAQKAFPLLGHPPNFS